MASVAATTPPCGTTDPIWWRSTSRATPRATSPTPTHYDAANVSRFERFTVTMISDGAISLQLYQNRELDEVDLGESSITTIQSDPSNEYNPAAV